MRTLLLAFLLIARCALAQLDDVAFVAGLTTPSLEFNPSSIANMIVGFEPRFAAYHTTGPDVQAAGGETVVKLGDYWSGNGYSAQQLISGREPKYLSNGLNGNIDILRITNSGSSVYNYLTNGSQLLGNGALTIALKARLFNSTATGRLFDNGKMIVGIGTSGASISRDAGSTTFSTTWSFVNSSYYNLVITFSGATPSLCTVYTNGVQYGSANQSTGTPANGTANLMIGQRAGLDRPLVADIAFLFVYSRVLDASEIASLAAYMQ